MYIIAVLSDTNDATNITKLCTCTNDS